MNNIEENKIHVYCICPDQKTTAEIETLEMSKEAACKYTASLAQTEDQEGEDGV